MFSLIFQFSMTFPDLHEPWYVYVYVCACVCVYICMCAHVYVCTYVCAQLTLSLSSSRDPSSFLLPFYPLGHSHCHRPLHIRWKSPTPNPHTPHNVRCIMTGKTLDACTSVNPQAPPPPLSATPCHIPYASGLSSPN